MTAFGPVARAWWDWMWPMAWQVALLAAAVLVVTLLTRKRSPHLRYCLWCLVLVKLCVPPSLALVTGVGGLLPTAAPVAQPAAAPARLAPAEAGRPEAGGVGSTAIAGKMPAPPSAVPQPVAPAPFPWKSLALALWAAGLLAMASLLALQYALIRRRLVRGSAVTDAATLALLDEARSALGGRRRVGLVTVDGIGSPVLFGLLRPRIVLPASALALPAEELRPILLHELAHLRRRDLWVNWAQAVLQSVYWFHPAVWLANARLRRERELIVDDMVLARLGGERTAYGASLVSVLKASARRRMLTPGYVGIAEPPGSVSARVRRILDGRRTLSLRLGVLGAAVVLAMGLVLIPQGRAASTGVSLIEALRSDALEERAEAAKELVAEYQAGRIDAAEARQILAILQPRLQAVAESIRDGSQPPAIYASELGLAWAFMEDGLVTRSTAIGLARDVGPSWCEYVPGGPAFHTHSTWNYVPAGVVLHRTVTVRTTDGQAAGQKVSESFFVMHKTGGLTWGDGDTLAKAPAAGEPLAVEAAMELYKLPADAVDSMAPSARRPEDIARLREALADLGAQPFLTYTESALLAKESGWRGDLMPAPDGTTLSSGAGAAQPYQATLPNGVTVELVGVSYYPSEGKQWWRPDGSPLAQAPYDGIGPGTIGEVAREFAVRLGAPDIASLSTTWGLDPSVGWSRHDAPLRDDVPVDDVRSVSAAFAAGQTAVTVRVGVAAGEWQTLARNGQLSGGTYVTGPDYRVILPGLSDQRGRSTEVTYAFTLEADKARMAWRLVAVDTSGVLHVASNTGSVAGGLGLQKAQFNGLAPDRVKEVRFEVRPYDWVEFRNVSLEPGQRTDVEVVPDQKAAEAQAGSASDAGAAPPAIPPELVPPLARLTSFSWSEKSGTVQQCVASLQKSLPINYLVGADDAALAGQTFSLQTETNNDRLLDVICELTGHGWQVQDGTVLVGSAAQFGSPGRLLGSVPAGLRPRLQTSVALAFKDMPFEQAAAFLQRISGIDFKVAPSDLPALATTVSLTTQTSVEHAVNILCILIGYAWEADDGAIALRPDPRPDRLPWRELVPAGATVGAFPIRDVSFNVLNRSADLSPIQLRMYASDKSVRLAAGRYVDNPNVGPLVVKLYPSLARGGRPDLSTPFQVLHMPQGEPGQRLYAISEPLDLEALPHGLFVTIQPDGEAAGEEKSP